MLAELVLAATTGWNAHAQLPEEYSAQEMSRYLLEVARPAWSESVPRRTGTCCHGMERPRAAAGAYSAQSDVGVPRMLARPARSESAPRTGACCHGMERPCTVARGVLGAGRAEMYAPVWGGIHQGWCRSRTRRNHGDRQHGSAAV